MSHTALRTYHSLPKTAALRTSRPSSPPARIVAEAPLSFEAYESVASRRASDDIVRLTLALPEQCGTSAVMWLLTGALR
jgi:hypothetical protein